MKRFITLALFTLLLAPIPASAGIKMKGGGWSLTRSDPAGGYTHEKFDGYEIEASDPDQAQAFARAAEDSKASKEALGQALDRIFTTPKVVEKVIEKPVYIDRYHPVPVYPSYRVAPYCAELDYDPPVGIIVRRILDGRRFYCTNGRLWKWCPRRYGYFCH